MLRALRSTTSRVLRLSALLATVAQAVIAAAPLADRVTERSAAAHVEAGGTSVHHAHNEAACPACAAQQLVGGAERRERLIAERAARGAAALPCAVLAVTALPAPANPPRAPPVVS